MHASNSNIHTERIVATVTIEEVTRLTGKTACVTPAVCAWYWTGQTHTPAPVLIGVLRAMPATLVSEPEKKRESKFPSCYSSNHFDGLHVFYASQ